MGSSRAGDCAPLTPAALHRHPYRKTENHEATNIYPRATRQGRKRGTQQEGKGTRLHSPRTLPPQRVLGERHADGSTCNHQVEIPQIDRSKNASQSHPDT